MATQRKKIGLLCLLLIVSGGWIVFTSRHGGKAGGLSSGTLGASNLPPSPSSLILSDPNLPSSSGLTFGNGELFLKMMLSVGLVIGLGGAALYLSKRVLPRVTNAPGKEIHILETAYLGPRKALHLVEVGRQRLLIASTSDHVTMLAGFGSPSAKDRTGEPFPNAMDRVWGPLPENEAWLDLSKNPGEAVKA